MKQGGKRKPVATCRVTPAYKCTGVSEMYLNGTQSAQRGHKLKLDGRSLNVARLNGRIGVTTREIFAAKVELFRDSRPLRATAAGSFLMHRCAQI